MRSQQARRRPGAEGIETVQIGIFAALLTASSAALACGHCVEDKIAGVYDHAAVTKAIGEKHTVVFFAIDGTLKPGQPMRMKIEKIAASVPGVDKGSVRVSMELASLALAFDPRRASLVQVQKALERTLAELGLSILAMRTMDSPGDLAAVRSR
jgi:hypothetical protein